MNAIALLAFIGMTSWDVAFLVEGDAIRLAERSTLQEE
jgi:hypothetical protein